jgi:hypothetical protein
MSRVFSAGGLIAKTFLNTQAMASMNSALDDEAPRCCLSGSLSKHKPLRLGWLSSSRRGKVSNHSCCPNQGLTNDVTEMVLVHDAFVALKSRCPLTVACSPEDYILGAERKLLQE